MVTSKKYHLNSTQEYWLALGEFVHRFSGVEAMLHQQFHKFAKIPHDVANVIKREMKLAELISLIKPLLEIYEFDEKEKTRVSNCLKQLEHLATFRNRVLHRGAILVGKKITTTNIATMKSLDSYEEANFTIKDLRNANADLRKIWFRLLIENRNVQLKQMALESYGNSPWRPWRYKPVQLTNPLRRFRKEPQARPPRKRPSPA